VTLWTPSRRETSTVRGRGLVPIDDSRELLKNSGLPDSALIVVGTEHRLADEESLEMMLRAVEHGNR
jgi:hypothetical protein